MQERPLLWLTWEKNVRSRNLSKQLGAVLLELNVAAPTVARYTICITHSLQALWQWRHATVVVQNPSLVLALQASFLRPLFGYRLVVDAHNAGIFPNEGNSRWQQALANFIIRHSDTTIVTNPALAAQVGAVGGTPVLLPDPLPDDFNGHNEIDRKISRRVLFICTWAADEPFLEVIKAATLLPDITISITGNSRDRHKAYGKLPHNVVLTGYLSDHDYHQSFIAADAIIDLTTRENCLVCGAYEAIAAGVPFVLSDTSALRSYFRAGGVFVDNTAADIAAGVTRVLNNAAHYRKESLHFREELQREWQLALIEAKKSICRSPMAGSFSKGESRG